MESGTYEFGGTKYTQTKLVWGQIKQLNNLVRGIQFTASEITPATLVAILGDKLPHVMAVLLTEEGASLKDKDLDALAERFEFDIPFDMIVQVIEDFFIINPIISVLEKLKVGISGLRKKMEEAGVKISTGPLDS
jgi:hypothetical protein